MGFGTSRIVCFPGAFPIFLLGTAPRDGVAPTETFRRRHPHERLSHAVDLFACQKTGTHSIGLNAFFQVEEQVTSSLYSDSILVINHASNASGWFLLQLLNLFARASVPMDHLLEKQPLCARIIQE